MNFKIVPVIGESDLTVALEKEYNEDFSELASIFWNGDYNNDSYKSLYFRDYTNPSKPRQDESCSFEDEEEVHKRNLIYQFLAKNIPTEYNSILIDVSW